MPEDLTFRIVTKSDLARGGRYDDLEDPEGIATMSDEKRAAVLTNPLSTEDSDPVQVLALHSSRVIGRMDLIRSEIWKDGETCPIYWCSALDVPVHYRGTGAGLLLILKTQSIHHTVGVCGVSRDAHPVYQRLGWMDFEMSRWVLPLTVRPLYERYVKRHIPIPLLVRVSDHALTLNNTIRRRVFGRHNGTARCRRVDRMTGEIEPKLIEHSEPIFSHRSAQWINWLLENKFSKSPSRIQHLYHIYDENNTVIGYFLIKTEHYPLLSQYGLPDVTMGSLMDWCIFDDQLLNQQAIIRLAIGELLKHELDAIEIFAMDEREGAFLKKMGFRRMRSLKFMFKASKQSQLSDRRSQCRELWRIMPADGDNFFS